MLIPTKEKEQAKEVQWRFQQTGRDARKILDSTVMGPEGVEPSPGGWLIISPLQSVVPDNL
jgi:hypothetical protein